MNSQTRTSPSSRADVADRLAVVDALYRFAAGIDQKDADLLRSAFTDDAVSDIRPAAAKAGFEYPVLEGRETIVSALSGSLAPIDTTHSVSNPRVHLQGDQAHLDALVEAQHVPEHDHARYYLMKNRYSVDLVRHGAVWLIRCIVVDNVWRTGDPSVLTGI
ncbi:nuclear transport factor 2 family protein [Xylophilus sp. GOD-11R]|uniref:nuclear transport factor 2 family protein n=1 Tax=Xylophilus sp. GOD-11R TaxID=3089814 RepID=UPI00298CAC67|nr:nuclear transport factor 2 family protein [Xylophilus sp. GOD-11R]WPB57161.1 nuclear transport factor 2 family protein [Xylophilus sp. GOD-11R]